ncbi:MAG TPA: TonB-dependent receptor, partial [Cyclobacteriaceae bacterium]|nr:TonB-dependent receptor [Cyclobacteriaceae bacterium]
MKHIILLWLVIGVALVSYSQTITIKEQGTDKPLGLVTFSSQHPKAFAISNSNGQLDISTFKGAEKIEIRILGFHSLVKSYDELST